MVDAVETIVETYLETCATTASTFNSTPTAASASHPFKEKLYATHQER